MNNLMQDFINISREIGSHLDYVQGAGGNTSIKLDATKMLIKASGFLLKDIDIDKAYSIVDFVKVKEYLNNNNDTDDEFSKKMNDFILETKNRPSIETGFHAILGRVIIHTHSVYANVLNCTEEGRELSKTLFSQSMWIDYVTPGKDLTLSILDAIKNKNLEEPLIIFLQNHGIIVSGNSASETLDLHKNINLKLRKFFQVKQELTIKPTTLDLKFIQDHIFFPDQVVFLLSGDELLQSQAAKETLSAYQYIYDLIIENNLTPHYLSESHAKILQNMESEKFRQKLTK